jgi:hypothetical protein
MNTLDIARNGRSAARQIRAQFKAGVLTPHELERLLNAVDAGFAQMMGPLPSDAPPVRAPRPVGFYDGARR